MLPDVALIEIFAFYVYQERIEAWHTLVHVCRKWRSLVFGSLRRLDLELCCTARTPVKKMLDVWPLLPIIAWSVGHETWGVDNVIAALERNDRLRELELFDIPSSHMEKVWTVMQRPFPALRWLALRLQLQQQRETVPVVPDSFLGGSAPHLQVLFLDFVPFPGLPKLLLSATELVCLSLWRIPHSGYISPEAIVTCLSVLTRLEKLRIRFESPQSRPDHRSRHPPPRTRTVLPILTWLEFRGVSEYLEDLVARIDAPLLKDLMITFFHQLTFDTPHLTQFISRTPKFKTCDEARVVFSDWCILFKLSQTFNVSLELGISCRPFDWQLSSLAQVCSSSFPQALIPKAKHLYIPTGSSQLHWRDDIENCQWLELFHPFTGVKDLYISSEFAPRIAPALQEFVGERATEVLPALETLFLETLPSGPVQDTIGQFVAARQLSDHPIAVSRWDD
jgi:hypothetical protein